MFQTKNKKLKESCKLSLDGLEKAFSLKSSWGAWVLCLSAFIPININNKKRGSLALSLVASGAVAATIVATHQLTQRFASGAVGNFGQHEAFLLAQRSLALAGLMVTRNVVLCSNQPGRPGQVKGCNHKGPLAGDHKAHAFYTNELKLQDGWFTVETNSFSDYGEKYLRFKYSGNNNSGHEIFKNAEITWFLRTLDSSLRSISGSFNKGYVCRNSKTFAIREGSCESMDDRVTDNKLMSNRDSMLFSDDDHKCKDNQNNDIADSVCDYYQDADGDDAVVFISVKVPYHSTASEEAEGGEAKIMAANGAVRRPMSIFKLYSAENKSVCPVSCQLSSAGKFPVCTSLGGTRLTHADSNTTSNSLPGKKYFPQTDDIHSAKTEIKIKNYGPGVLYGVQLLKEDIYPSEDAFLGRSVIGFTEALEPTDALVNPAQDGVRNIVHYTPCYNANFYRSGLQAVTCHCDPANASSAVNTARGVICKKGTSVCAGSSGNDKSIFASTAVGVLQDSHSKQEARGSLSGCIMSGNSRSIPALTNSLLTVYEKNCKDWGTACEFTRIDDDQPATPPKKSWCGAEYVAKSFAGYTGNAVYPSAQTSAWPNEQEEIFMPASSQHLMPVPVHPALP